MAEDVFDITIHDDGTGEILLHERMPLRTPKRRT